MHYYNDQFSNHTERVSCNDRGFLLGDGVFETLRCYQGLPFRLHQHLARLRSSLSALEIPLIIENNQIQEIITTLIKKNNLLNSDACVRITVTRGVTPRGLALANDTKPTLLITAEAYHQKNNQPLRLTVSNYLRNEYSPLCHYKTLNYLENILAQKKAVKEKFDDAVLRNTQQHIVCTTAANIFFIIDNVLHTPSLQCGALSGITRQTILEIAAKNGIETVERSITINEIQQADEIFICNSLIEIQKVAVIDNFFADKKLDYEMTDFLLEKYRKLISRSTT